MLDEAKIDRMEADALIVRVKALQSLVKLAPEIEKLSTKLQTWILECVGLPDINES